MSLPHDPNPLWTNLERVHQRPSVFSAYTAAELWTEPHLAAQMLSFHLNPDISAASRDARFLQRSIGWFANNFPLDNPDTRVADFGCGPGLYTVPFAELGAQVTGIDFSPSSVAYSQQTAAERGVSATHICQDCLAFDSSERTVQLSLVAT